MTGTTQPTIDRPVGKAHTMTTRIVAHNHECNGCGTKYECECDHTYRFVDCESCATNGPAIPTTTVGNGRYTHRRISDDLVIARSSTTYWSGYSYTVAYLPVDDETPMNGGRYVGTLGYRSWSWMFTDDAVFSALMLADTEWATHVAPFI